MPEHSGATAPRRRFWARVAPALLLLVLSPLIAEFLLGDLGVRQIAELAFVLPLYGGGALFIRELTRRTGRGWPTIVLLAVAYGMFEEGVTTMSLFNSHYAGIDLLRYGFLPALGTSFDWDVFVVAIHVVFSISTPILIAEGVAGPRRTQPWLRTPGFMATIALFLAGAVITTGTQIARTHFVASAGQLAAAVVLIVLVAAAAFVMFRPTAPAPSQPTARAPLVVWFTFPLVLVLLSAFELIDHELAGPPVPAWLLVLLLLALLAAVAAVPLWWSRRPGWAPLGPLAIAAGAAGTYSWLGVLTVAQGHTNVRVATGLVDVAGQMFLVLIVFVLVALGVWRSLSDLPGSIPHGP